MLPPFQIIRPSGIEDACQMLRQLGAEAIPYAGGTELIQAMKMRLADPRYIVDLKVIGELQGIVTDGAGVRIGSTTTHAAVALSPELRAYSPAIAEMARAIGNVRVRAAGTVGGNLVFAEPHSDPATLFLAAGAHLELAASERRRLVEVGAFVKGPFESAREPDEILVAVVLPPMPVTAALGYGRVAYFERPSATVAVRLEIDEQRRLRSSRIAVGSVGAQPRLLAAAEMLDGASVDDAMTVLTGAARLAAAEADPIDDLNGSVAYKRNLVAVLVQRAGLSAVSQLSPMAV